MTKDTAMCGSTVRLMKAHTLLYRYCIVSIGFQVLPVSTKNTGNVVFLDLFRSFLFGRTSAKKIIVIILTFVDSKRWKVQSFH